MDYPIPELPNEPPFQNFGDYSKERMIRDLQELHRILKLVVEAINDLNERVTALEP